MRKMLLTTAAVLGLAATAAAQTAAPQTAVPSTDKDIRPGHVPGVGESYPASTTASNITPADTHSPIAPRLPTPMGGENASANVYLSDAQNALNARQTGRAQEALERAETAMLQRSVPADQAMTPDNAPDVKLVVQARDSLAKMDINGAKQAIAAAMTAGR